MPELQERDAAAMPNPDADPPPPFQLARVLRNRGPSWPIGCSSLRYASSRFWTTDTPVPRGRLLGSVNPAFLPVRARLFRDTTCVAVSKTPHNCGPPRVSDSGSRRVVGEDRAPAAVRARRDSTPGPPTGKKTPARRRHIAQQGSLTLATIHAEHQPLYGLALTNAETAYRVTKEPVPTPEPARGLPSCAPALGGWVKRAAQQELRQKISDSKPPLRI